MQVCVRRRAELSVAMNPHCGPRKARAAVDKVFDRCFADTAPFDRYVIVSAELGARCRMSALVFQVGPVALCIETVCLLV